MSQEIEDSERAIRAFEEWRQERLLEPVDVSADAYVSELIASDYKARLEEIHQKAVSARRQVTEGNITKEAVRDALQEIGYMSTTNTEQNEVTE